MFSPDQYVKENISGDVGPCILLDKKYLVDNYVINYADGFQFTFIEYLRHCFHWAGFANLQWAKGDELKNFLPILEEVRSLIRPF